MINYKIINKTDIYETQTQQMILTSLEPTEAKKMVKHFNLGGGFDGFTPEFFNIKFKHLLKAK